MADLTFDIVALDKASDVFKKIGKEADGMGGKFKAAGALLAGAFAGIGGAVLKTGFDELKDAQAGAAQLAAGIKSTGGAAGVTVDQMEKLASSIQSYSGQTDDSIVDSEKLLLTFTNIKNSAGENNDIFTQATKVTADMAARMGTDASSAAIQLGKALNDPVGQIGALTRVGVTFSDAQKKQIDAMVKAGDVAGAQKVILAELNKEFGGSARAAGETLPGQLARARRSFEDVSQSVAQHLLPIITSTFTYISNNMSWIGPLAIGLGAVAAAVVAVNAAMTAWQVVTKIATGVQIAFNAVMDANPVILVVAAIAALAAGLVIAYNKSETFRKIVQGAFGVVKSAAEDVAHFFTHDIPAAFDAVTGVGKDILDFFGGIPGELGKIFSTVGGVILAPFKAVFNLIAMAWNNTIGRISFHVPSWVPGIGGKGFSVPNIPLTDVTVVPQGALPPSTAVSGTSVRARARGGPVSAGQAYIVGEHQPELFVPNTSGMIYPSVGGGQAQAPLILQLDGRKLAEATVSLSRQGVIFLVDHNGRALAGA